MISVLGRFIFINALLAVFNLIPVPPLDGAKVIGAFLPGNIGDKLNGMGMMEFFGSDRVGLSLWALSKFTDPRPNRWDDRPRPRALIGIDPEGSRV